jgi:hypothetical protein
MRFFNLLILSVLVIIFSGCGYTTSSLLPPDLNSIHVANFANKIDPTKEITDKRAAFFYRPGLETDITRKTIDDFIYDGHLDVKNKKEADLLLEGDLVDLEQYPLSYSKGGDVEEYRVEIFVNLKLFNNRTGKLMWKEDSFMGQSSYDITGPNAKSEGEAINDAVRDLSVRIVERTVEAW